MIRHGIHPSATIDTLGRVVIPKTTVIEPQCVIFVGPDGQLDFGEQNTLYPHVSIRIAKGWMRTGREVSFGPGVAIYEPRDGLEIGDYCMIAGGTMICGVEHETARLDVPMRHQPAKARKITIGDDVWIGMRAVISAGVTIGSHSIIGAGSVVLQDIPPNTVAWGTPCVPQRPRT